MLDRFLSRLEAIGDHCLIRGIGVFWLLLHGTYVLWSCVERLFTASARLPVGPFA